MTAMLDTNAIDNLLDDRAFIAMLNSLSDKGKLTLFVTGVLKNQLQQTRNEGRRAKLLETLSDLKATYLPVEFGPYGYAYGECYGGLSPHVTIDHHKFIAGNNKQIEDVMIAATASSGRYQLDYIVTDDKDFIRKMNGLSNITKAITFREFKETILALQDNYCA